MTLLSILAQLTIILPIFFNFKQKLYEDHKYTKKLKLPLIVYILFIVLAAIPVLGLIAWVVIIAKIINSIINNDLYYKPGRIIKFLFKEY